MCITPPDHHVPVHVGQYREDLLAVRLGLHQQFDAAFTTTKLPDRPDYARANAFLLKARRQMVT